MLFSFAVIVEETSGPPAVELPFDVSNAFAVLADKCHAVVPLSHKSGGDAENRYRRV